MHVVMRLRPYEAPLSHDDVAGRREVLHPVAPLQLVTDANLGLHLADCYNRFDRVNKIYFICGNGLSPTTSRLF